jgi:hypothetical protein
LWACWLGGLVDDRRNGLWFIVEAIEVCRELRLAEVTAFANCVNATS